jgi:hypothetical protein
LCHGCCELWKLDGWRHRLLLEAVVLDHGTNPDMGLASSISVGDVFVPLLVLFEVPLQ